MFDCKIKNQRRNLEKENIMFQLSDLNVMGLE